MKSWGVQGPKVSVIMPVYNCARYVAQAIESVLAQTYTDWELNVIDDGSTDETPTVLAQFSQSKIIVARQANRGEAAARNRGLSMARGEYIAFLDADDLYLPEGLAGLVAYLEKHPEQDVVYSDGYFCDEKNEPMMKLSEHRLSVCTGNILEQVVLSPSIITVSDCTLSRRSVVVDHQIRYDESLVVGPDWDFWIQVARFANFGYFDSLTCMYRVHDTNVTRTSGWKKRRDDLVKGRLKVANAEWFDAFDDSLKYRFFFGLLIGLLSGKADEQEQIFCSKAFLALPHQERAKLHRAVAIDSIMRTGNCSYGRHCLEQALASWPGDRKSSILLRLLSSPGIFRIAVFVWRILIAWQRGLFAHGKREPRPVPPGLAPVGN